MYTATILCLFAPFVLFSDLGLLLWSKVVDDVEGLTNVLRSLSLDQTRDFRTCEVKEGLNIHVVGSKDELEERLLIHRDKI